MREQLVWYEDFGFYPAKTDGVYDAAYFAKYEGYAATPLGVKLNDERLALVRRYMHPELPLVDVGIGCGQFVQSRPGARGFDVNPTGVEWLKSRGLWHDPYKAPCYALTFWDSLEHVEHLGVLLQAATDRVFVSLPIFRDREHVLASKHFRPDEHFWYFTRRGFVKTMAGMGFDLLENNDHESRLGREGIESFAFRRHCSLSRA